MNYLIARIAEIDDADFNAMIDELYHCLGIRRDDGKLTTLFYVLQSFSAQDPKALSADRLPFDGILTTKIGKLPDGVVYDICRELCSQKRLHIEAVHDKPVLWLLRPKVEKAKRARKPTRNEQRHDAVIRIINQRRANGDL